MLLFSYFGIEKREIECRSSCPGCAPAPMLCALAASLMTVAPSRPPQRLSVPGRASIAVLRQAPVAGRIPSSSIPQVHWHQAHVETRLTADEEQTLALDMQLLRRWTTAQEQLTARLKREPTNGEWCAAIGYVGGELSFIESLAALRAQREWLIVANLRFVAHVARKYGNRGVCMQDIVQEGTMGLIAAAERFDPARGARFSSYSVHYIQKYILLLIANSSRLIRLPVRAGQRLTRYAPLYSPPPHPPLARYPRVRPRADELLLPGERHPPIPLCALPTPPTRRVPRRVKRLRREFMWREGRWPTIPELAHLAELTHDQLHCALRSEHGTMSLDTLELTHTIRAPAGTDPAEALAASDLRSLLRQSLAGLLDPRDAEIMTLLYALDGMGRRSADEVGTQFKIEAKEVVKIEARCLRKLQGQRQLAVRLHSYLES